MVSAGGSSGEGCGGFDCLVLVLQMKGSFDLSPVVTQVVLEVYVTSVHLRNTETKGDPLHLQIPFTA